MSLTQAAWGQYPSEFAPFGPIQLRNWFFAFDTSSNPTAITNLNVPKWFFHRSALNMTDLMGISHKLTFTK